MKTINDQTGLNRLKEGAALLLFGGESCGVCHALKPKLEAMLVEEFPALQGYYLDCQGDASSLCAQQGVFSLPVVQVWFDGRKYAEFGRVFSLNQVREAIARPYQLAFATPGAEGG